MAQELFLEFATVYQCAVKHFKHVPQNRAVCILLLDKVDGSLPLSDAVCSHYINGKRAIPDNYRDMFAGITEDSVKEKFKNLKIFNLQGPADALRRLIDHVRFSGTTTYNKLVQSYLDSKEAETPEKFLADVFRYSVNTKGSHPLSEAEQALISTFASTEKPQAAGFPGLDEIAEDAPDPDSRISAEDLSWMRDYIPRAVHISGKSFFGTPVAMELRLLKLPQDFVPLLYLLKPVLKEVQFSTFTFGEFLKYTGISSITGNVERGTLQYLKVAGSVDGIIKTIHRLNLEDICSVVMLMRGTITEDDFEDTMQAIKAASFSTIPLLRGLIFDREIPNVEVTLIIRVDPDEAKKLRDDYAEQDGDIQIYK